jgi:hypothetical protein
MIFSMLHRLKFCFVTLLAEIMKEQPAGKIYVACYRFRYVSPNHLAHDCRFGSALTVHVMLATFVIC